MRTILVLAILIAQGLSAQSLFVRDNGQQYFQGSVPAGNYSGITYLGNDDYAIVSDKSEHDGFFIFNIQIDTISGRIKNVSNKGFVRCNSDNGDLEGIAYDKNDKYIYLCSEAKNTITEYSLDGKYTGKCIALDTSYPIMTANGGLESLAYNDKTRQLWTINEMSLAKDSRDDENRFLRVSCLDKNLNVLSLYAYAMDEQKVKSGYSYYANGVSELAVMDDGRMLVLEREFYVPKLKIGAYCKCKIYIVNPTDECLVDTSAPLTDSSCFLKKEQLHAWETRLSLFGRSIANYEGMCLGPCLSDGNRVLLLVSDSQNQYKHVLKDWFKTIIIRKQ